ncbi:MAG: Arginine decarboxylase [Brockia lithotrophica]|uniref:Arginine decarboxylase n=1 Tax=Brockia lithotrophica TaxID=933949 RepID=A0A2T5G573_9BACL|nr:MAG: Arginine decarboxylase [Brockia lithotrophica]
MRGKRLLDEAPLFRALWELRDHASFHVPGHHGGRHFPAFARRWFAPCLRFDATELPGLDNLHAPEGVIREAEARAAEVFGAEETKFLVGGSTAGILALILGTEVALPRRPWIVERASHASVWNGLSLAGAEAVVLPNPVDSHGLPHPPEEATFREVLRRYPDAKAVLLTSPTYFGFRGPLRSLIRTAKRAGLLVYVDEAHGAHFRFSRRLPRPALDLGADAVVQSLHKTLPVMGMGSLLHFRGKDVPREAVREALRALETSSPSYVLLATMDLARAWYALRGRTMVRRALNAQVAFRKSLARIPWLRVLPADDPFRLILLAPPGEGARLEEHLRRHKVYCELVLGDAILCLLSPGNRGFWRQLYRALASYRPRTDGVRNEEGERSAGEGFFKNFASVPPSRVSFRFFWGEKVAEVPLSRALGRVSARALIPVPPGIPLVLPGERISSSHLVALARLGELGHPVLGLGRDGRIWVLDEA